MKKMQKLNELVLDITVAILDFLYRKRLSKVLGLEIARAPILLFECATF